MSIGAGECWDWGVRHSWSRRSYLDISRATPSSSYYVGNHTYLPIIATFLGERAQKRVVYVPWTVLSGTPLLLAISGPPNPGSEFCPWTFPSPTNTWPDQIFLSIANNIHPCKRRSSHLYTMNISGLPSPKFFPALAFAWNLIVQTLLMENEKL